MSEHNEDAVVERIADPKYAHQVRDVLAALKPGDRLPGGLRVVPEEASDAMVFAATFEIFKALTAIRVGREDDEVAHEYATGVMKHDGWAKKYRDDYRAMLAALDD